MAIQTQLFSLLKKGKFGTEEPNKKLAVVAVDWDVELQFQETSKGDDWNFQTKASVKIKRDMCDKISQALFVPLQRDLKKMAFEGRKESQSKIIRDAFVEIYQDKTPYIIRVLFYLKIENKDGKTWPNRLSKIELYKAANFDEVNAIKKSINYDTKLHEAFKNMTPLASFDFTNWGLGSGTWVSHDQLDVDGLATIFTDITYGHNYSYGRHLDRVYEASGGKEASYETASTGYDSTAEKPNNAVNVETFEDEFPF